MGNWYIYEEPQPTGPYTLEQMQDFLKSGKINKETYIIKEGDSDWRLLMEYSEFNENSATQN
ncbi:MAG TPA: DUF4339 domain-containing protein, partial [bacterium]|nr:DUF4339 domain-containing protein [bacterium]